MNVNFQLLNNTKVGAAYWKAKAGSSSIGTQDAAVAALRKFGYTGTLNDMLRAFYMDMTGETNLMNAIALGNGLADRVEVMDFAGKVKADGDNTRIMKYGANTQLMNPAGFTSEVGGGYAGSAAEDDAQVAYWSILSPVGSKAQFCMYVDLSSYGTRAELTKEIKSLRCYVKVKDSTVYAFNNTTGLWAQKFTKTGGTLQAESFELVGQLDDYLGSDNIVKIGVIANAATDGATPSRAEIDYFKLTTTLLK